CRGCPDGHGVPLRDIWRAGDDRRTLSCAAIRINAGCSTTPPTPLLVADARVRLRQRTACCAGLREPPGDEQRDNTCRQLTDEGRVEEPHEGVFGRVLKCVAVLHAVTRGIDGG